MILFTQYTYLGKMGTLVPCYDGHQWNLEIKLNGRKPVYRETNLKAISVVCNIPKDDFIFLALKYGFE